MFPSRTRETFDNVLTESKEDRQERESNSRTGLTSGRLSQIVRDHRHRLETTGQQTHTSLKSHLTVLAGARKQFQRKPSTWWRPSEHRSVATDGAD